MANQIRLPVCGIEISLDGKGGGTIVSPELRAENQETGPVDGVLSLILACACEGIDVTTPQFLAAIEVSIESCLNYE